MRPGLIEADELRQRLQQSQDGIVILDLRHNPDDGRPKISGSVHARLHDGFAMVRPERRLQYDLPSAEEYAGALSHVGIEPGSTIVLADDMGNRWATRVYWLLKYFRHPGEAMVLNGGAAAWAAAGFETAPDFVHATVGDYPVPSNPDGSIRASAEDIAGRLDEGSLLLCDVRTAQEFSGEVAQAARGGHIPGAVLLPWDRCLDRQGRILPDEELRQVLKPYLEGQGEAITYCQGGIRASLTWFALNELLGRPARLYPASWEEWGNRPDLPVAISG